MAQYLDLQGIRVFIDVHDYTLAPGQGDLDGALMTAIDNSNTMIIVVSDKTQASWWVPWEVGVSTPYPAYLKPSTSRQAQPSIAGLP